MDGGTQSRVPESSTELPGFWDAVKEARRSQRDNRLGSYSRPVDVVCGEVLWSLRLRDIDALELVRNPLVLGGQATPGAALSVLWLCNTRHVPGLSIRAWWERRQMIRRAVRWGPPEAILTRVQAWLADAYSEFGFGPRPADAPPPPWPVAGPVVSLVTTLQAEGLALTDDQILDMPMRILAQKRAVLMRRRDPDWSENDAAMPIRRRYKEMLDAMQPPKKEAAP